MVDTIHIRVYDYPFNKINFDKLTLIKTQVDKSQGPKSIYQWGAFNFTAKQTTSFLLIQGSITKHQYNGFNVQNLTKKQLDKICKELSETTNIPLEKMEISRIDLSHNFYTTKPVSHYLAHIRPTHNRYKPSSYLGTGKSFRTNSEKLMFYDKTNEAENSAKTHTEKIELKKQFIKTGKNILRFEMQIRNAKIKAYLKRNKSLTLSEFLKPETYLAMKDIWSKAYFSIGKEVAPKNHVENIYGIDLATFYGINHHGKEACLNSLQAVYKQGIIKKTRYYSERNKILNFPIATENAFLEIDKTVHEFEKNLIN